MITWRCEQENLATTINLPEESIEHSVLLKKVPGWNQQPL
jgi:hypothetical protein